AAVDPRNYDVQRFQGAALRLLGEVARLQDDHKKSQDAFQRCLTVARKLANGSPSDVNLQLDLLMALASSGQRQEAAELAGLLRPRVAKNEYGLRSLAWSYQQCAASLTRGRTTPLTEEEQAEKKRYTDAAQEVAEAARNLGRPAPAQE